MEKGDYAAYLSTLEYGGGGTSPEFYFIYYSVLLLPNALEYHHSTSDRHFFSQIYFKTTLKYFRFYFVYKFMSRSVFHKKV